MEEPAAGGLPQWTGVYAAFDDVALAALANRGLVRRGRAERDPAYCGGYPEFQLC